MAKVSPFQNVFEGELSPLTEGRTDIDRYKRAMRFMRNMVPCRTGPAISRSGTYYEGYCIDPNFPSKLFSFEFNENDVVTLEFGHFLLRFRYDYNGLLTDREKDVNTVVGVNPFVFTATGHDFVVGEHIIGRNFPAEYNVNNVAMTVVSISGAQVTTDYVANAFGGALGSPKMAVIYEVATPYHRDDIVNLRLVQEFNVCYLFCFKANGSGDYKPYTLKRYDTWDWRIEAFPFTDGPYMDVNVTDTRLVPEGKGTWVPDMTSATLPAGKAAASSEITGHEAWKAFDGDIDSYWEANASQEGWLEYSFQDTFVNILPDFTGPTSGAFSIVTPAAVDTGYEGWKIADRDNSTEWRSTNVVPQEIQFDLGTAQTLRSYTMRASKNREEYGPRDFTLQGATVGLSGPWTTVDTHTGLKWDSGQRRQFDVTTPGSYRYYRFVVTAVNPKKKTVTITPAVGKKGKKGYIAAVTQTTYTAAKVAIAETRMSVQPGALRVVNGYTIYLGRYSKGKDVTDHAPKTFYFEGWDGDEWDTLDSQQNYTHWPEYRSDYFPLQNPDGYLKYRLRIKNIKKEGDINPRIGKLVLSSPDAPPFSLRATSKIGINDDRGFLPTDVGRLIRMRDQDQIWRCATIAAVTDETHVTLSLTDDDPLVMDKKIKFWRLGLWSDTTGYPTCGTLHEDRLFCGGASGFPDHIVGSKLGEHTAFVQINRADNVFDEHAIVTRCISRYMSRIVWMKSNEEALRIGTGKSEFILAGIEDSPLTPRNFRIRQVSRRGSCVHDPVTIDNDIAFIQKGQRQLYASTYAAAGAATAAQYKAPLMSKLGQHLVYPEVVQIVYQQEPHSVIWGRRIDNSVVAMTYSNDDDVFGGHRHNFASQGIFDLCSVYSPTDRQDTLWMVVKRENKYNIERMYRFWDFGDILTEDATFVDCALRYYGTTATDKVYGLRHLEGRFLDVLADKIVYKGLGPVTNGMLQLARAATYIVVGIPYTCEAEIVTPDVGAEDGTPQGKSKRPHSVVLRLWESARGEVGRWDEDHGELMWTPVEYNIPGAEEIPEITLQTTLTKTIVLPGGYGQLGTVRFRQTEPLPFNVVAVYPQTYVEDER